MKKIFIFIMKILFYYQLNPRQRNIYLVLIRNCILTHLGELFDILKDFVYKMMIEEDNNSFVLSV